MLFASLLIGASIYTEIPAAFTIFHVPFTSATGVLKKAAVDLALGGVLCIDHLGDNMAASLSAREEEGCRVEEEDCAGSTGRMEDKIGALDSGSIGWLRSGTASDVTAAGSDGCGDSDLT